MEDRLSGSVSRRDWVNLERRGHAARKTGFVKSASDAVQGVIDLSHRNSVRQRRRRLDRTLREDLSFAIGRGNVGWWCLQHKRSRANWVAEMAVE